MSLPVTYKRLVLSGDKAKESAKEAKDKFSKEWKKDYSDAKLDIKDGVEGKIVIDITTKDSSAAALASKIKDVATKNKVTVVTKDKPSLKAVKEIYGSILAVGSTPVAYEKPVTNITFENKKITKKDLKSKIKEMILDEIKNKK